MMVLVDYTNNPMVTITTPMMVTLLIMKVWLTSEKIMVVVVTNAVTIAMMLMTMNKCAGDGGEDGW